MLIDPTISFLTPNASPVSIVGAAGVAIQIGQIVDLLGLGVGISPGSATIIGTPTVWGTDFGIGAVKMQLQVLTGAAATTATSATADFYWEFAPDNGSAQPGTWQTVLASGPLTAAQLAANTIVWRPDFPPAFPANLQPRFTRLVLTVPSATDFTAGTIASAILIPARDDTAQQFAARNYVAH